MSRLSHLNDEHVSKFQHQLVDMLIGWSLGMLMWWALNEYVLSWDWALR